MDDDFLLLRTTRWGAAAVTCAHWSSARWSVLDWF